MDEKKHYCKVDDQKLVFSIHPLILCWPMLQLVEIWCCHQIFNEHIFTKINEGQNC